MFIKVLRIYVENEPTVTPQKKSIISKNYSPKKVSIVTKDQT